MCLSELESRLRVDAAEQLWSIQQKRPFLPEDSKCESPIRGAYDETGTQNPWRVTLLRILEHVFEIDCSFATGRDDGVPACVAEPANAFTLDQALTDRISRGVERRRPHSGDHGCCRPTYSIGQDRVEDN